MGKFAVQFAPSTKVCVAGQVIVGGVLSGVKVTTTKEVAVQPLAAIIVAEYVPPILAVIVGPTPKGLPSSPQV